MNRREKEIQRILKLKVWTKMKSAKPVVRVVYPPITKEQLDREILKPLVGKEFHNGSIQKFIPKKGDLDSIQAKRSVGIEIVRPFTSTAFWYQREQLL